jgi:hypothetical protein
VVGLWGLIRQIVYKPFRMNNLSLASRPSFFAFRHHNSAIQGFVVPSPPITMLQSTFEACVLIVYRGCFLHRPSSALLRLALPELICLPQEEMWLR